MEVEKDHELIKASLEGDLAAFGELVYLYESYAFNLAMKITKNREEAEEVAQDAFVKVYKSLDSFRYEGKFSAWLYTIVYRESISRLRKLKPVNTNTVEIPDNAYFESDCEDGIERLTRTDRSALIHKALGRLKPEEASVLTLFYLEEMTLKEIDEITGMSVSNVKVHLHRGRKNLLHIVQTMTKAPLNEWL